MAWPSLSRVDSRVNESSLPIGHKRLRVRLDHGAHPAFTRRGAAPDSFIRPAPRRGVYLATVVRVVPVEMGNFGLYTAELSLEDITFVSNAIRTTVLAKAFDMNVSTVGSLLDKLSHQRDRRAQATGAVAHASYAVASDHHAR